MSDLAKFYNLIKTIEHYEVVKRDAKETLDNAYDELVEMCPHSEAVDWNFGNRSGDYRICTICGLEDLASEGGVPGDEYDYGYPGYPSKEFWKNSTVHRAANSAEFQRLRRDHQWVVKNGKAYNYWKKS